ncbi:MAG: chemotaxis protein CheY [Noviherbaspirillum sp.]|nr:chemotaxis protein CheY [Noviherbaspirillum sp.]
MNSRKDNFVMPGTIARILVVDDEPQNLRLMQAMLKLEGYSIQTAGSGEEALALIAETPPDLILLDVMMPGMSGYQVVRKLKTESATMAIPVILVSAIDDRRSELAGLHAGAEDYLTKPVDRFELTIRVRNLLRLKEYNDFLDSHNRLLKQQVRRRTVNLRDSYLETIFALTRASKHKDEETGAHVQRISYYCKELAETLGMESLFVDNIFYSSPMHDIGKIAIPDHILVKPGKHTSEETEIMRQHCFLGAEILGSSTSPYLAMGAEIALNHHEYWDGSGYPNGIKGDAIPLSARIMAICDVYDALRSRRPYKPPFEHEKAVQIISKGDGRTKPEHFDPAVLNVFTQRAEHLREIYQEQCDDQES